MTDDTRINPGDDDVFSHIDPWVTLEDGRRQLLAALDACDPRSGARMLTIPEFANLGEASGTLWALLLSHAARDRAHAAFFVSLDQMDSPHVPSEDSISAAGSWSAVRAEVDAARIAMLEAAARLASEHWERPLLPSWEGATAESLSSLLVVRAMCDGILAEAVATLTEEDSAP